MLRAAFAAAAFAASATVALAQVELSSPGGSSVHVGRDGAVDVRSAGGSAVHVQGDATSHGHATRGHARRARVGGGCPDGRLEIAGSGGQVDVAGPCRDVEVSGTRNTVHVGLAPGARVSLAGSHNLVVWTLADPRGAPPHIERSGTDNRERRG